MENLRLGVSAVRHDMRREETVEEVEKNTELERHTPKRQATGSNPAGGAKNDRCKPIFDGLHYFSGLANKKRRFANTIFPLYFSDGADASKEARVLASSGDLRSCSTRASKSNVASAGSFGSSGGRTERRSGLA